MNPEEIVRKFESRDSLAMWKATWEILRCGDKNQLRELEVYIPRLRRILSDVPMGGALHSNENDTKLAFSYIENTCKGVCRCNLYTGQNFFNPIQEEEFGFVKVTRSEVLKGLFERHFEVICSGCASVLFVREIHGWHVPWYEWKDS